METNIKRKKKVIEFVKRINKIQKSRQEKKEGKNIEKKRQSNIKYKRLSA